MDNRGNIELKSGVIIQLEEIQQAKTYAGLIEGQPTAKLNKELINRAIECAENTWNCKPALINPLESTIKRARKLFLEPPIAIPKIRCIALFKCLKPARDKNMDLSELPIVWFQDAFAFPIADSIMEDIILLNWKKLAHDYDLY